MSETAASATTFENPVVDSHEVPELHRKVCTCFSLSSFFIWKRCIYVINFFILDRTWVVWFDINCRKRVQVTIYASGSVTVDGALDKSSITLSQDDIRAAIGVGGCWPLCNENV